MLSRKSSAGLEPWLVGVLFSQTGVMSVIEQTQLRGTLLAIEEINAAGGVNGRELLPIVYDPASENSLFRYYAQKLLIEDGVAAIFGCYTSSSRKAVLPIVERLNGLLMYPTLYEGYEYSSSIIYTGATPNQNLCALVQFLLENCGRRFYFVGSDYVYPRETNRTMRELLHARGGEIVGEAYVPVRAGRKNLRPILRDIKNLMPEAIFSTVVGNSTTYLYQTYAELGFDPKSMPITSLTTTESEIRAMGHDVGEGHITAASYFQSIEGELNSAFVGRYKKQFGDDEPTNMCAEAAYFQVHLLARGLEQTNTMDPDLLRPMILHSEMEAPQGPISMNPLCSHANLWSRVGRADRSGQFDILCQSKGTVVADPYMTEVTATFPVP
jgi:branched-chain amino acid transport system substrate-binding protein